LADAGIPSDEDHLALGGLISWLTCVLDDADLKRFGGYDQQIPGQVRRLRDYLLFRRFIADPARLSKLADFLKDIRIDNFMHPTTPASVADYAYGTNGLSSRDGEARIALMSLASAAAPSGMDSNSIPVPDAAIWFRYILLLSYRATGLEAFPQDIAPHLNDWTSLDKFWSLNFPGHGAFRDGLTMLLKPDCNEWLASNPFLNWHAPQPQASYTTKLAEATAAAYDFVQLESRRLQLDRLRFQNQHLDMSGGREQEAAANTFDIAFARHIAEALSSINNSASAPGDVTETEWAILNTSRINLLGRVQDRIEQMQLVGTLDNSASKTRIRGYGSPLTFNLYALPERTFSDFSQKLDLAIKNLKTIVQNAQGSNSIRQSFEDNYTARSEAALQLRLCQWANDIASNAVEISMLSKAVAERETEISRIGTNIAALDWQSGSCHHPS
jgi:hypothetical protein